MSEHDQQMFFAVIVIGLVALVLARVLV